MTEYKLKQLDEDISYIKHELFIIKKWKDEKIYQQVIQKNKGREIFRFIDGPPFISSDVLHLGHLLVSSVKDTILRYKYMSGYDCTNKIGYDVHGLPMESTAYKLLNISTHKEVNDMGIAVFNGFCKELVNKYANAWNPIFDRIGRNVDLNNTYRTCDLSFMESVWSILKCLWDKDLVYCGCQIMPYSIKCGTSLSNFEASSCYKVIETDSIYVKFPLKNDPLCSLIAWTTTPWTLPCHIALCVNPDAKYVKLTDENGLSYIIAENLVEDSKIRYNKCELFGIGKKLIGIEYIPPYNYLGRDKYIVIADNFVMVEYKKNKIKKDKKDKDIDDDQDEIIDKTIGSGIVHLAPCHGQDDLRVCLENNIIELNQVERTCLIDKDGNYNNQVKDYVGMNVLGCDKFIIKDLKEKKLCLRVYKYKHKYPHCYRTETPLIYKAESCWFIKVTALRDKLLNNNKKMSFIPAYIGEKRFHHWLDNVRDWCISRNRYFGTPIPIWITDDNSEMECIGSIKELTERAVNLHKNLTDIHPEFINDIKIISKSGKLMKRINLVLDCWFESGSVPLSQYHYPFENKDMVDTNEYLCDFIAEGLDQTRGWFYTLLVLSTALFDKPVFKTCICTGLILDENGIKFSKKYGNFKNPIDLLDKYGADTIRLYLLSSPAVKAEPLLFNEQSIDKIKHKIIPYINGVKFFLEHTINYLKNGNSFDINIYQKTNNITDQWIISRITTLLIDVKAKFESYQLDLVVKDCLDFIDDLTNWYIKFNRDRLKGLDGDEEAKISLSTLYRVLITYCKIMAPITPFLSEYIYDHLKVLDNNMDSIHLCDYPNLIELPKSDIELRFCRLQEVSRMIRKLRLMSKKFASIKIPIKQITIIHQNNDFLDDIKSFEEFISEELNFLSINYKTQQEYKSYSIKFNEKILGQKYKSLVNDFKQIIKQKPNDVLRAFMNKESTYIEILLNDKIYQLTYEDLEVLPELQDESNNSLSITENGLTIIFNTIYDDDVHNMYQMRRFTIHVQNMRKTVKLHPWDKINIYVIMEDKLGVFFKLYEKYIFDRLKNMVININSASQINKIHYHKDFEWINKVNETIIIPVFIELQ